MATHQHAHQRISIPITIMTQCVKIVAEAIEKENMRDQEKIKNSYIGYFRVRIKDDAFEDKTRRHYKSVVSRKERL